MVIVRGDLAVSVAAAPCPVWPCAMTVTATPTAPTASVMPTTIVVIRRWVIASSP